MNFELADTIENRIAILARERHAEPSAFATELLAHALEEIQPAWKAQPSADELMAGFVKLAETATPVRNYPEDFFSRDVMYADHD